MPDIAITATDRYSGVVKQMTNTTKAFHKDVDSLEEKLYQLSRTKATIQVDVNKAKKELQEAQKQFAATGDAAA